MPPLSSPTYSMPNAGDLNEYNTLDPKKRVIDTTGMPPLIYRTTPLDPDMPSLITRQQSNVLQHNKQNPEQTYAMPSNLAPPVVRTNKPSGGKRRAKKSVKQRRKKGRHTYRRKRRSSVRQRLLHL